MLFAICKGWSVFCLAVVVFITLHFCALSVSLLMSYCLYPQPKKNNWWQRHEAFIQTMRQGRGSVPPQSASNLNSEYVSCPHCGRRFAPGPAERHIPKCQNIRSRPPPPKQPHSATRRKITQWLSVSRHMQLQSSLTILVWNVMLCAYSKQLCLEHLKKRKLLKF